MLFKGRKALVNKADEVRKLLTEGATRARIVVAIANRCVAVQKSYVFGQHAAIAQVMHVLKVDVLTARALVTEHMADLNGNWKMLLDKLNN